MLTEMFAVEEVGAAVGGPKAFLESLTDETWVECLRFGPVEVVAPFAADAACAVVVRFETTEAAAECVRAMEGRWFNERCDLARSRRGRSRYSQRCMQPAQARLRLTVRGQPQARAAARE